VGWRSRRLHRNQLPEFKGGIDNVQEEDLHIGIGAIEGPLEFLDQDVLEMQFGELFSEGIQEDLVKNSQRSAVKLCRPRFGPFLTGNLVMSHALQADMEEELLERNVGIRPS
jgi:hypothetical protein